jgi:hypothetical protein
MAGGMNRRGERASLHERIHGAPPLADAGPRASAAPSETARVRRCWVTDEHGRQPGLLLEWRQTLSGWQGRVVRPVREDGCWVVVEEWLAAALLTPG